MDGSTLANMKNSKVETFDAKIFRYYIVTFALNDLRSRENSNIATKIFTIKCPYD